MSDDSPPSGHCTWTGVPPGGPQSSGIAAQLPLNSTGRSPVRMTSLPSGWPAESTPFTVTCTVWLVAAEPRIWLTLHLNPWPGFWEVSPALSACCWFHRTPSMSVRTVSTLVGESGSTAHPLMVDAFATEMCPVGCPSHDGRACVPAGTIDEAAQMSMEAADRACARCRSRSNGASLGHFDEVLGSSSVLRGSQRPAWSGTQIWDTN